MEFRVDCSCGGHVVVSEAAAGSSRQCACGRTVPIPSLKELRLSAGLPAYNISPEALVEHILSSGELPCGPRCGHCGEETTAVVHVVTECERSWTKGHGELSLGALILLWLFCPIGILVWYFSARERRVYGSDKIYALPLRVCSGCRGALHGEAAIKRCLAAVPAYARLLEKCPDARVRLAGP